MIILLKLLLAHLAGDFLLQPDSWVNAKETKKLKSLELYMHSLIHFILIMLLVWDFAFWKWASLIAAFHFITDVLKLYAQHANTKRIWFFADQALHLLFIYLVWIGCQNDRIVFQGLTKECVIALITILYAITQPASAVIRSFISRWSPDNSPNTIDSLDKAGKYIGILERLFVFAFVITNNWAAIGFLLAAKSVFRFGDLKESRDRKLTEYVLIGTLLSFGIAMLAGIIFLKLIAFLNQT